MIPVFIYHPCSGDRVFAHLPTPSVRVVKYDNGCRHVLGGAHIALCAGDKHTAAWRTDARALAHVSVAVAGGIAWDDRGDIHFVVPDGVLGRILPFWDALRIRHGLPTTVLLDFILHGVGKGLIPDDPDDDRSWFGLDDDLKGLTVTDDWPDDGKRTWTLDGAIWTTPTDWSLR